MSNQLCGNSVREVFTRLGIIDISESCCWSSILVSTGLLEYKSVTRKDREEIKMPPRAAAMKEEKKSGKKVLRAISGEFEGQETQEEKGELRDVHLQSFETSAPRYWHFYQSYEYHEFVCQRYL